jgi:hypothetical protein
MNRILIPFITILGGAAMISSIGAAKPDKKPNHMEKIVQVDSVSVTYIKKNPPQLKIDAHGKAASMGWTKSALSPHVYIQPPPDGVYDFDFDAVRPTGIVPQVLTPISAELVLKEIPKGMKGVRVHAKTNSKEAKLEGPK